MGQSAGRICTGQIKAHIPPTMSAQGNTIIRGRTIVGLGESVLIKGYTESW